MARVLGYGGLGNTNGLRSFAGKVEAILGVIPEVWNYWRERRLHRIIRPWMGRP